MIGNIFKVLISVKAKLFFGFLAMTLIISLVGGYAFLSLGSARTVVKDTFDRPLMAINFARSAGQVFSALEIELLTQLNQSSADGQFETEKVSDLLEQFKEDLSVAKDRSIAPRAETFFQNVDSNVDKFESLILTPQTILTPNTLAEIDLVANEIEEQLDIIVELQTNQSFRARETSLSQMSKIERYSLMAVLAALFVTLVLSAWIAVTIIQPLKAAALAAHKISSGNFDVDIPKGRGDETGVLLNTMSAMQKNIRDRMGKEQSLRELAQSRLSDSLGNSKDAILLTNKDGIITVANPKVEQIFPALTGVDLLDQPYDYFFNPLGYLHNETCEYYPENFQIKFSDGRWARVSASNTQDGGRLYIWNDITDQKDRSQKLQQAKNEAEAADKAKTVFLAAMSHELRTPLNAVIGFAEILESHHKAPGGSAQHAEMAGIISKSGAQLLNIVKDILSISKDGAGENTAREKSRVNMIDIVEQSIKSHSAEAAQRDIEVSWTPPRDILYVNGEEQRLQQMLDNVVSNAVKYNRSGGVVEIRLSLMERSHVRLDVMDSGIGIETDDLSRILEPFVQVDSSTTRKYEGVGLGLSIANQILKAHDGNIHMHSKIGEGTAVTLIMPALTMSQPASYKMTA